MTVLPGLSEKIRTKKARIGIVGLGYVGLPLAVAFAERGFQVVGIDTDRAKVSKLNRGFSYVMDVPSKKLKELVLSGRVRADADYRSVPSLDAMILCVPTPHNMTKKPNLYFILAADR